MEPWLSTLKENFGAQKFKYDRKVETLGTDKIGYGFLPARLRKACRTV
jgi:hypothetical protein